MFQSLPTWLIDSYHKQASFPRVKQNLLFFAIGNLQHLGNSSNHCCTTVIFSIFIMLCRNDRAFNMQIHIWRRYWSPMSLKPNRSMTCSGSFGYMWFRWVVSLDLAIIAIFHFRISYNLPLNCYCYHLGSLTTNNYLVIFNIIILRSTDFFKMTWISSLSLSNISHNARPNGGKMSKVSDEYLSFTNQRVLSLPIFSSIYISFFLSAYLL